MVGLSSLKGELAVTVRDSHNQRVVLGRVQGHRVAAATGVGEVTVELVWDRIASSR